MALCLLVLNPAARARDPSRESRERALDLFQASVEHYEEGRYGVAAELLREAYELHPEPLLLYNLGRALDGMGDAEGAVQAYHNYLEAAPGADDRALVEERITILTAQIEAERPPPEEPDPGGYRGAGPYPWLVASTGAVALGTGAVLWRVAQSRHEDAMQDPVHESAAQRADRAQNLATAANVLLITGGTLLAAGLAWISVDVFLVDHPDATVSIGPAGVTIRGHF